MTGLVAGIIALTASSAPSFADSPSIWPYTGATTGHRDRASVLAAVGDISCQPGGPVEAEKQKDVCDKTGTGYQVRWQAQTATADEEPDLVAIVGRARRQARPAVRSLLPTQRSGQRDQVQRPAGALPYQRRYGRCPLQPPSG